MLSSQGRQLTASNPHCTDESDTPPSTAGTRATADERSLRIDTSSTIDSAPHGEEEEDRGALSTVEKSIIRGGEHEDPCGSLSKGSQALSHAGGSKSSEGDPNPRAACGDGPPLCYARLNTEVPGTLFSPCACVGVVKAEPGEGDKKTEAESTTKEVLEASEETLGMLTGDGARCCTQLDGEPLASEAQATACAFGEGTQALKDTSTAPGVDHEKEHEAGFQVSRRHEESASQPDSGADRLPEEAVTKELTLHISDSPRHKKAIDAVSASAARVSEYCSRELPARSCQILESTRAADSRWQPGKDTAPSSASSDLIASDLVDIKASDIRSLLSSEPLSCASHSNRVGVQCYTPECQPSRPGQPPLTSYSAPAASHSWVCPEKGKERRCIPGKRSWLTSCQAVTWARLCSSPCFEADGLLPESASPTCLSSEDRKALVWSEGFSLPLGKLGRQKLLRQLRLKYHTNRDLWRSRLQESGFEVTSLPRMGVEQLWAVANLMGLFNVAVEIAFEHATSKRYTGWQQTKYESCPECPSHPGQPHGGGCSSDSGSERKYFIRKEGKEKEIFSDEESGRDTESGLNSVHIRGKHSDSCRRLSGGYSGHGGEGLSRRCSSPTSRAPSEESYVAGRSNGGALPARPRQGSLSCWRGTNSESRRRSLLVDSEADSRKKLATLNACKDIWTRAQGGEFRSLSRLATRGERGSPEQRSGFCSSSFSFSPSSMTEHASSVGRSEENKDTPPRDLPSSPHSEVHFRGVSVCSSPSDSLPRWGEKSGEQEATEGTSKGAGRLRGISWTSRKRKGGTGNQARAMWDAGSAKERDEQRGDAGQSSRESKELERADDDDVMEQSIAMLCEQLIKMASRRTRDADEERAVGSRSESRKETFFELQNSEVFYSSDSRSADMNDEQEPWSRWRGERHRPSSQVDEPLPSEENADRTLVALCSQLVKLSQERTARERNQALSSIDIDRGPWTRGRITPEKEGNCNSVPMRSEVDAHLARILEELFAEGDELLLEDLRRLHFTQTSESTDSPTAEANSETETLPRTPENLTWESTCQLGDGQDEVIPQGHLLKTSTGVSPACPDCDADTARSNSLHHMAGLPRTPSSRREGNNDPEEQSVDATALASGRNCSRPCGARETPAVGHGSRGNLFTSCEDVCPVTCGGSDGHVTDEKIEKLSRHQKANPLFPSKRRKTGKAVVNASLAELVLERIQDIQLQLELLRQQIHSLVSA